MIKYENMSYKTAVHHAHQVLCLASKANKYVHDLFDPPDVSITFECCDHNFDNGGM